MEELTLNVSLLSPVSDLITGASVDLDLIFGRAGNDIFYTWDPLKDANAPVNVDVLFGDLFDNTPDEFEVTRALAGFETGNPDPFAILNPGLPDIPSIGADKFVLGDEFQPYYADLNPFSLLSTNFLGFNEFAVIYDFDPNQDTIQLNGKKNDYFLLKIDALPVNAFTGGIGEATNTTSLTDFSGYALFSLQSGIPDIISLIVQKPSVELELKDKDAFLFVGDKPEKKPEDKKVAQFGTTGLDSGDNVVVDASGNLYVVGSTSGSLNGPNRGSSDVWVTKYDPNGNQLFAKQFGSSAGDSVVEVITDAGGNFYLAGSTGGSFVDGLKSPTGSDAWVAKYDPHGNPLWGRQFGENSTEGNFNFGFSTSAFGLQVDDSGNIYLSGLSINDNDPANGGKGILDFPAEDDSWVLKLNSSGVVQWSTKITAPAIDSSLPPEVQGALTLTPFFDESYDLAVDKGGNSYLVGWTQGLSTISDPGRDLQKYDAWVSKVDPVGKVVWTQQFGTLDQGLEFAWAVDTDSKGNVYVSGWTTGEEFNGEVSGGFKKAAERDVFLAKFSPEGALAFVKRIGSAGDDGQFFSDLFIDESDNIFLTGYTDDKLGKGKKDETINAWVGRFDTNGNNQWIQQLGVKDKADYATGVTASNGKVFVTGFTEGFLGTSNNAGTQGAAIDGWLAELDIEKGKLQKFEGNAGGAISIADPGPISTPDITNQFAVGDDLPRGNSNMPNPGVYYGDILSGMAPYFDPNAEDSFVSDLRDYFMDDPSVFGKDIEKLINPGGTGTANAMMGFNGKDKMKGTKSSDTMYGLGGDDELDGDDGRDILHGGTGNDELKGGDDNDMLVGVDINFEFGTGEIDKMKGEKGADMFVLGDASRAYYLGKGNADYALIEDFDKKEGDKVQLHGEASDYSLGLDIKGLDKGMAIFLGNDLVGIVKDVKSLELTDTNVCTFISS